MSDTTAIPEPDAIEGAPHPRQTAKLFAQEQAERVLLEALAQGRLDHGWMITGPRGVGKATLAWRVTRFLLQHGAAPTPVPPDSFDTDPQTLLNHRIGALSEPRLFLCRRPWDSRTERLKTAITVDEVRSLKGFFGLRATDDGHRVVIVDCADEMNPSAANALLKVLEEPPAGVTLFLISHRPMRLLPTIRSRCREVKCAPLDGVAIARALNAAGFDAGENAAALAELANGSAGEAIRLLSGDGCGVYASISRIAARAPGMDRASLISLADSCAGKAGQARYDLVLRLIDLLLHRLARAGIRGAPQTEAAPGEAEMLGRLSPDAGAARGWAECAQTLGARSAHARAVNLDPASVILDMMLRIDQTARSIRAA